MSLRARSAKLGSEVDVYAASDEPEGALTPYVNLRRLLGGGDGPASLRVCRDWAKLCDLPTVRRGSMVLARRAESEKAVEFFEALRATAGADRADRADDNEDEEGWEGALPPLETMLALIKK